MIGEVCFFLCVQLRTASLTRLFNLVFLSMQTGYRPNSLGLMQHSQARCQPLNSLLDILTWCLTGPHCSVHRMDARRFGIFTSHVAYSLWSNSSHRHTNPSSLLQSFFYRCVFQAHTDYPPAFHDDISGSVADLIFKR